MKIGCTLPQFRDDPTVALEAAQRAESVGLDGVFVFDHLSPLSGRDKPILSAWPLLGALAATTSTITLGTLVARVGVVPDAQLVSQMATAHAVSGGRFVAGLGTGDRLSFAENEAYGLPVESATVRIRRVEEVIRQLTERGIQAWIGGRHPGLVAVARRSQIPLNLWGAAATEVETYGRSGPVTWGGQVLIGRDRVELERLRDRFGDRPDLVHGTVDEVAEVLASVAAAGAIWAVMTPLNAADPTVGDTLAEVKARLSL